MFWLEPRLQLYAVPMMNPKSRNWLKQETCHKWQAYCRCAESPMKWGSTRVDKVFCGAPDPATSFLLLDAFADGCAPNLGRQEILPHTHFGCGKDSWHRSAFTAYYVRGSLRKSRARSKRFPRSTCMGPSPENPAAHPFLRLYSLVVRDVTISRGMSELRASDIGRAESCEPSIFPRRRLFLPAEQAPPSRCSAGS
jgi:hypothetical protein